MSLSQQIDKTINDYISLISERYNIKKEELQTLWVSDSKQPSKQPPTIAEVDMDDLSIERLMKCNKVELTALCKSKG